MGDSELLEVRGGGINASMINALVRFGTIILELGRSLGTIIKRTTTKNMC